ncbi:MAG: TRAP transporter small permease [Tistlia sp.]|uniref:TRAP transporter small permease n=1 Tax=Tistlia sp. TaxID=3057121 RepID=UPI0034A0F8B0
MQRAGEVVNRIEEGAISFFFAVMVLTTFVQVVLRYVFNTGFVWALELTTYCFAWMVLIGISWGVKINTHLGVDAFVRLFPGKAQRALVLFGCLCCIAYAGILLAGAWEYISKIYRIGIPTEDLYVPRVVVELFAGGEPDRPVPIPRWIPYAALPIGLALLLFRFCQAFWLIYTGERKTLIAGHEVEELAEEAQHRLVPDEPRPGDLR